MAGKKWQAILWVMRILCISVMSTPYSCVVQQGKSSKGQWIKLFNGKNLKGWKVKITGNKLNDNYGNTFRVEDGILKVCYDKAKLALTNQLTNEGLKTVKNGARTVRYRPRNDAKSKD